VPNACGPNPNCCVGNLRGESLARLVFLLLSSLLCFLSALFALLSITNNLISFHSIGTIYANDYFEVFVNGKFIKGDPIDYLPNQAVTFTFSADTTKPIEYAIYFKSYSQDSTGLRFDHSQLGVGESSSSQLLYTLDESFKAIHLSLSW